LTNEAQAFIKNVEKELGAKVALIGTGAEAEDLIDLRE